MVTPIPSEMSTRVRALITWSRPIWATAATPSLPGILAPLTRVTNLNSWVKPKLSEVEIYGAK